MHTFACLGLEELDANGWKTTIGLGLWVYPLLNEHRIVTVRSRKVTTIALTRAEEDPGADIWTEEVLVEDERDKRWGLIVLL